MANGEESSRWQMGGPNAWRASKILTKKAATSWYWSGWSTSRLARAELGRNDVNARLRPPSSSFVRSLSQGLAGQGLYRREASEGGGGRKTPGTQPWSRVKGS